jgi:hypothetical protein
MDTHYLVYSGHKLQITMATLSKARNILARLNIGIVGLNPTPGVDIRLRVRCPVRVLISALRWADPSFKKSYQLYLKFVIS